MQTLRFLLVNVVRTEVADDVANVRNSAHEPSQSQNMVGCQIDVSRVWKAVMMALMSQCMSLCECQHANLEWSGAV